MPYRWHVALQLAIIGAILGYLVGIPWSIWFRLRHGRWPQSRSEV